MRVGRVTVAEQDADLFAVDENVVVGRDLAAL
jgi:hypothetical protein